MSLDLSNYELRWPTSLFVSEGERVLRSSNTSWGAQATWLLTEALAGTTAVADFEDLSNHPAFSDDPWATDAEQDQASLGAGVSALIATDLGDRPVGSARVPGILNVGKQEPACQLMAAAVPRAGSGSADGTW